jgi:hypothetical protein
MAALALAMREVLGPTRSAGTSLVELATTASFRHSIDAPIGDEVGCYVSMLHMFMSLSPDATFWDLARQANRLVQESLAREEHWAALQLGARMAPTTRARAEALFDKVYEDSGFGACISNLGKVPFPDTYGPLELRRAYGFGALSFSGLLCVGVFSCRGRTEICSSFAAGTISSSTVSQIIDRFRAELVLQGARSDAAVAANASQARAANSPS